MVLAAEPDRELMWLAAAIERRQAIVHALLPITKVSVGSMITQPGNLL
jgi:mannose/fructose/N-acetylgalactosamine-specific phosphotransferase system component IIB